MNDHLTLLLTYLKPQRRRVVMLAALLVSGIGLQLLGPQLLSTLIDLARDGAGEPVLVRLAIAFLAVIVVRLALAPLTAYVSATVGWNATNALREAVTLHCLTLDLSFHTARTPGQLIERVDGDIATLSNFFSEFAIRILGGVGLIIGALIVLLLRDWRMGLALTIFTGITAWVLRHTQGIAVPYFKAIRAALATFSGFVEERISGTEDIRGIGAVPYTVQRLIEIGHDLSHKIVRGDMMQRVNQSVMEVMIALGYALTFTLGALLLNRGAITLGVVFLVFDYTFTISRHLSEITNQLDDLANARASIERVAELQCTPNQLVGGARQLPENEPLAVVFQNVTFGYAADTPVLNDISFELSPGQKLGLVGRTGSGKTTLGRLLSRFYTSSAGSIRLNGIEIDQIEVATLRQRIGVVTQDVQLFHGTVRDNLTFWDDGMDDAHILGAIEQLGLHDWLKRLPRGLDTVLLPGGGGLSAGEAQLLALGRVFLQNPGLVILDEASARLDPVTERWLDVAISRLLQGRTALIIAHRLSTVLSADQIIVLENGHRVEQGARVRLQHDSASRFAQLLRAGQIVHPVAEGETPHVFER